MLTLSSISILGPETLSAVHLYLSLLPSCDFLKVLTELLPAKLVDAMPGKVSWRGRAVAEQTRKLPGFPACLPVTFSCKWTWRTWTGRGNKNNRAARALPRSFLILFVNGRGPRPLCVIKIIATGFEERARCGSSSTKQQADSCSYAPYRKACAPRRARAPQEIAFAWLDRQSTALACASVLHPWKKTISFFSSKIVFLGERGNLSHYFLAWRWVERARKSHLLLKIAASEFLAVSPQRENSLSWWPRRARSQLQH